MRKKVSVSVAIAITLIAMTVTFSITMIVSMNIFDNTVSDVLEKQALYNKISELDTYIRANFYGDIDDDTLNDRVAQGFIDGLGDGQSSYYTAEEYALMQDIEAGRVVGIGIVASKDPATGYFRVIKVYPGSPAEAQGVEEGMLISQINTEDSGVVNAKNINTSRGLASLLRGEQGTMVELQCETMAGEVTAFEIRRINYSDPTVESHISNNIAYIRIYAFTADTAADFDFAVREAEAAGVIGFVFDLRNTSEGSIDHSYDMIDLLCPLGTIARAELKNGVMRSLRMSDENYIDLPMVCLVNGNTAGAAELFAVCVRDLAGGQIAGTRTAGRGMLQRPPQQLLDGSAVSITYAKLYPADSDSFEGVGVEPDLEVIFETEDDRLLYNPDFTSDVQLRRSMELVRNIARGRGMDVSGTDLGEEDGSTSLVEGENENEGEGTSETGENGDETGSGGEEG